MRSRPAIDLRSGGDPSVTIGAAGPGRPGGAVGELRVPALVAATGLIIAWAALSAPAGVRVPAEAVAGLLAPGVLYFSSFARIPELPIRLGASLIGVIASWTSVGTAGYAIHHALYGAGSPSDELAILMLIVVYLLGLGTVVVMRSGRLWSGSDPPTPLDAEPGPSPRAQDSSEHPSDH
jgi:hypothetical protein